MCCKKLFLKKCDNSVWEGRKSDQCEVGHKHRAKKKTSVLLYLGVVSRSAEANSKELICKVLKSLTPGGEEILYKIHVSTLQMMPPRGWRIRTDDCSQDMNWC